MLRIISWHNKLKYFKTNTDSNHGRPAEQNPRRDGEQDFEYACSLLLKPELFLKD